MNQHLSNIELLIQQAALAEEEKQKLLKEISNADKQWNIIEFKLDRTEKVKHTTAILLEETIEELEQKRKAVEEQNRELEIATALERVRAVAMSMKEPADMLEVCSTIALQLEVLHVNQIRNVQTAIFYESKGTYMNYEYYAKHNKTFITETSFTNHKMHREFAVQMLKGKDEFFTTYISKAELPDWIAYQKTTNVFIDTFLETATSLTYYWYSLGPVALGISTYEPLTANEQDLFKRFLKVFELAYRRYLDIENAQAQAREAQIEASLERVRTIAMSMMKPDDLLSICETMFHELKKLGFEELRNTMIDIHYDEKEYLLNYDYAEHTGKTVHPYAYHTHDVIDNLTNHARQSNGAFTEMIYSEEALNEWRAFRKKSGEADDARLDNIDALYYYFYSIGTGAIGISMFKAANEEQLNVLKRFRNVFDLAYKRYIDITNAEMQAREAEIQLALERVRARSLAMHHTSELQDVVNILSQQLHHINIDINGGVFITINDEVDKDAPLWASSGAADYVQKVTVPFLDAPVFINLRDAIKKRNNFLIEEYSREEKIEFFSNLFNYTPWNTVSQERKQELLSKEGGYTRSVAISNYTSIAIINHNGRKFSDDDNEILKRFGNVFEQAYTRFLDLQKAEAQAREAQIQLALERVRSRAMAMQSSEELKALIGTVFTELTKLDLVLTRCIIWVFEPTTNDARWWMANSEEPLNPLSFLIKYHEHPAYLTFVYGWKNQNVKFIYDLKGQDKINWDDVLFNETELKHLPDVVKDGMRAPERVLLSASFNNFGGINLASLEPLSDEQFEILLRFAKVFDLTYTRFLDLQKAEAQAREAQIQLALERVRARTMAMQKQNDLLGVLDLLVEQLVKLGVHLEVANFSNGIPDGDWDLWIHVLTSDNTFYNNYIHFTRIGHPYFNQVEKNIEIFKSTGLDLFKDVFSKEENNSWQDYIYSQTVYKDLVPQEHRQIMYDKPGYTWSMVLLKNTWVSICRFDTVPFSDEEDILLRRFANAFGQAYTRFLDLQKAEAQARESEMELALERVRAKTMAMQKSDELQETTLVLFQQFKSLGATTAQVSICVFDEDTKMGEMFVTLNGEQIDRSFQMELDKEVFVMKKAKKAFLAKQKNFSHTIKGKQLQEYNQWRNLLIGKKGWDESEAVRKESWYVNAAFFSRGMMGISSDIPPADEAIKLLERFANVFDLTFTRFLDLQRAEAQAKESQVQLALERVRARTMAMQKSDELSDAVYVLFQQFKELGENPDQATIGMINEEEKVIDYWVTLYGQSINKVFKFSIDEPNVTNKIYTAWKENKRSLAIDLNGKALAEFMAYRASKGGAAVNPNEKRRIINVAFFSKGLMNVQSNEERSEESIKLLERFAAVFDQTYTRFLDLQKAEAQAREGQIQLALERARAQSMIMQHSTELDDTLRVFHEQVLQLNIPSAFSFLWLPDEEKDRHIFWAAWAENNSFRSKAINYPLDKKEPATAQCLVDWKSSEPVVAYHIPPAGVENYFAAWSELIAGAEQLKPEYFGDGLYYVEAFMKYGCFGVMVKHPLQEDEKKIMERFAIEFERAYTRFLDLQKAEEQTREAQIEVALEKVRSRSLAMHKSDELKEAGELLWNELGKLGIESLSSGYVLMDKEEKIGWIYAPNPATGKIADPLGCVHTETKEMLKVLSYWKKQEPFSIVEMNEEETIAHQTFIAERALETDGTISHWITAEQLIALSPKKLFLHNFNFKQGYLMNVGGNRLTDKQIELMLRFTKVFQQTYTRFLDLQKAEEQTREAKIEAALEKVRSRSLAMHNSDELREVVAAVFEKLDELITIAFDGVSILIPEKDSQDLIEWVANPGKSYPEYFKTPYIDNPMISELLKARDSGVDFFSRVFGYDEKNVLWKYAFENSGYKNLPDEMKKRILESDNYAYSVAFQKNSSIVVASISGQVLPEKEVEILKRFARAFEQSYIRFLDLQKAEAQAREAEIELALERVRARAMAMQHQNDLLDVTDLFDEQLMHLGLDLDTVNFSNGLSYDDWDLWVTSTTSETERSTSHMVIPWIDHPYFKKTRIGLDNFKKGIDLNVAVFNKAEKDSFLDHLFTHTIFRELPEESKHYLYTKPGFTFSTVFLKETWVSICKYDTNPFTDEQHVILRRFANAFGQAYTRFLDLKKAETQAREAQIETALERVRSRTLAMQRSDELAETSAVLFKQLIYLGISPNRLYISIIKDENGETEFWITDEDGSKVSMAYEDNLNNSSSFKKMYDGWRQQKKSLVIDMKGKELADYLHYLSTIHVPFKGGLTQKRRVQYIAYFSKGFIGMASPDEQPVETLQLLERFAYVFNLTFTRFNDLQLAEAHAVQAEQDLVEIKAAKKKAEDTLNELQLAQKQLVQSEKMASLGELTAGIAHEIQNPLNFVNNFSEVSNELIDEMNEELKKGDVEEAKAIALDIKQNLEKINHHGKRADGIVKGMLQHSRTSSGQKELTDINVLADEYLRLAYHGLRAKDKTFNAKFETDFDNTIEKINIIPQDIGRVILNLINNAFYAVNEKLKAEGERQKAESSSYVPTVAVATKKLTNSIELIVKDNGSGIPQNIVDKIFQPFFTTKPTGQGTGLGLSLSYDIIKAHGGEIKVETKVDEGTPDKFGKGEGTTFIIALPT